MGSVEMFYDALVNDEALRGRIDALNDEFNDKQPSEEEVIDSLIIFAKAEGYGFTAGEYKAFAENSKKMSDEDLKAVAGGDLKSNQCLCILGGAGYDRGTKEKCYCVAIGVSSTTDKDTLTCVVIGVTD
jgi:hypothetical protein